MSAKDFFSFALLLVAAGVLTAALGLAMAVLLDHLRRTREARQEGRRWAVEALRAFTPSPTAPRSARA